MFTYKIAFWNVNMGQTSPARRLQTAAAWVAANRPDVLVLEEVNSTIANAAWLNGHFHGLTTAGIVQNSDSSGALCNCVAVMTTPAFAAAQPFHFLRPLRPRGGRRLRARAVARLRVNNKLMIYGLHANASAAGGSDALDLVSQLVGNPSFLPGLYGGDFNRPIRFARGRHWAAVAAPPRGLGGGNFHFTQWKKVSQNVVAWPNGVGGTVTAGPDRGPTFRPARNAFGGYPSQIQGHDVIDYVIGSAGVVFQAETSIGGAGMWRNILTYFDHTPVLYSFDMPP